MTALLWLLLGLALFLAIATPVGLWLARKPGFDRALAANINDRIRAWWVIVAVVGGALWLGPLVTTLLFAFLSTLALREVLALSAKPDNWVTIAVYGLILPLRFLLVLTDWYGLFSILIPVYAFFLLPALAALSGGVAGFMARTSETQWALMVAVYSVSHLPGLMMLDIPGDHAGMAALIAWVIVTVQASDVAQFIWGKAIGRRKVAPTLSPSKTWEGLVGGTLTATLIGAGLWWLTPFGPLWAAAFAALLTALGFLGGLILSAVKRDRGVKDWGALLPGHGGVMDRLDSLIFAAPVFFHLVRYGWSAT
jgi:phosphatidate cytidylyltransferase